MSAPIDRLPSALPGDPFHPGERALQAHAGVRQRMAEVGARVIRGHMPEQHRAFFAELPFVLIGSVDGAGQPWATLLSGPPGFIRSPEPTRLRIEGLPAGGQPLAAHVAPGAPLGLLGIQPHTRRRNRANGRVSGVDAAGFDIAIEQSFGNCPKYIRPREARFAPGPHSPPAVQALSGLDDAARRLIARADTFFIASAAYGGVDVSHRGGEPGFVHIDGDVLTVPDYAGNLFFNTLGNLLVEPRAGLLFIDFARGDMLQLSVRAEVIDDAAERARLPGAQRVLSLSLLAAQRVRPAPGLSWSAQAVPAPRS
ncbi:pyridoxamine 5'-phosphate oxidase family protein [Methyloversatilis thermotolerans]|uniref:pyridoxamine 5'-phosphate oxidase family protein n=1 Tax=Methyloversatilis thermotolerans TaxID=1346290 RepID=UPI0009817CD5|nr:pyridoxamine 5'-phosphate oxidase family protein [Methyloversatilis thermotolerans]